jgi:tetratricopeptide (TPR) repeat protein
MRLCVFLLLAAGGWFSLTRILSNRTIEKAVATEAGNGRKSATQKLYQAAIGKDQNALKAFEIGNLEMTKKNYRVAREYFRLALSLAPANEHFIQAMRDAEKEFQASTYDIKKTAGQP